MNLPNHPEVNIRYLRAVTREYAGAALHFPLKTGLTARDHFD